MMRKTQHVIHIALYIILALSLAACRQSQQTPQQDENTITIDLQISPEPATTGDSTLLITLTDKNGQPVRDAKLDVRGDMTHAGMQPVSAVAEDKTNDGLYQVPFQWTMSGDWVVTVSVTLPDGKTAQKTFDLTVLNP